MRYRMCCCCEEQFKDEQGRQRTPGIKSLVEVGWKRANDIGSAGLEVVPMIVEQEQNRSLITSA